MHSFSELRRVASVFLFAIALSAQVAEFQTLTSTTPGPSPRVDAPVAYDSLSSQLWLFGGLDSDDRNDLWRYSLADARWQRVDAPGAPDARHGHSLTYDPVGHRLLVFAGQARGFFADVWAFAIAENRWTRLASGGAGPNARYAHSAVYDARRNRLVISHGFTSAGRFDDTWAFELRSNQWTNLSPSTGRPLRRCLHHAVIDDAADRMLLYGGCASGFGPCPLGDLWSFDLERNRWTEIGAEPRPAARERFGLTFDSRRSRMVLYGGTGAGKLDDVWEFDPAASRWSRVAVAGLLPAARSQHEAAYAAGAGLSLFFGGASPSPTNELLALGPGIQAPPAIAVRGVRNAFSGDNTTAAPGQLISIFGTGLGPTIAATAAFDNGQLPRTLAGVRVTVNGVDAPVLYAQNAQVNAQFPYEVAGQTEARVRVTVNGVASADEIVAVSPTAPGLFGAVWNQDGARNTAVNPAARGSVVVLYATGQGITIPLSATGTTASEPFAEPAAASELSIGGLPAEVLFRGQAPGTAGVMQINARIPGGTPPGNVPAVLRIGGRESAPVTVAVR